MPDRMTPRRQAATNSLGIRFIHLYTVFGRLPLIEKETHCRAFFSRIWLGYGRPSTRNETLSRALDFQAVLALPSQALGAEKSRCLLPTFSHRRKRSNGGAREHERGALVRHLAEVVSRIGR